MRAYHRNKYQEKPLYPCEPWNITEDSFSVETNHHNEAIFSLGNGYMGMRGTLEEDYSGPDYTSTPGMYINGVYGSEEIIYPEEAPDLPRQSQTMLNLAKWSSINLYINGEKYDLLQGEVSDYSRSLDMKKGVLLRELTWTSPGGKKIFFNILRFLSQDKPHLGMIIYKFKPLNFSGHVLLKTRIMGDSTNYHHLRNKRELVVKDRGFQGEIEYIIQKATSTFIATGMACRNVLIPSNEGVIISKKHLSSEKGLSVEYELNVEKGKEYSLQRYLCVYTSLDLGLNIDFSELENKLKNKLINNLNIAVEMGDKNLLKKHTDYMAEYWSDVDVKIYGDLALQQAFRFNAFHLLQSTGRDGRTNIAAKGLTGEYYEGHYFWDTETYIMPFFLYSRAEIAKSLLMYRYHNLDKARKNARRVRLDGALFPWRTINGEEASGFFMGSTVQYHINADIAYAIYQYYNTTKDKDFLHNYGAEILVETARMWIDHGGYIPLRDGKFCINEVCGPDEYKPGVNNNCYTNYMARFNLQWAIEVIKKTAEENPKAYRDLKERIKLEEEEIDAWQKAADNMFLPFNKELGIHPQDDSFLYKEAIDVDAIPSEEISLVKHWHPLVIWKYQVIKQADVILLMLLLGNLFSLEEKKANYDFYEPKTTHDSSLSPAIHSIIANEIGYMDDAYNYFMMTARLDLDDYNNNAYQGVHTACMAGSWLALIKGFAGMRNYDGKLYFNPCVPRKWKGFAFKIKFQDRQIKISVKRDKTYYKLITGEEIRIFHKGERFLLSAGRGIEKSNF
ncbi:glycoside hydrolase family 65 protein [Iocasia frigidifontis]|uniref:Glycoside hydrolase family 65 protein n=1 Tax=Iocasia fonsfrigidae TaxID=2682810 RepID=A0A8A7KCA7_9FIRM|nr:glycosyl hydrolase family 65 protein [Iocasia fonsfrigidae]QTL99426.1 glycoside hydrolase family 65 protein [Iocasia fonsfrigidae]